MQTTLNAECQTEQKSQCKVNGLCVTEIASLPDGTIIDQTKLAEMLCVTTRTIRRMVSRHELPPPVTYSGHKVWLAGKLRQHLESRLRAAEIDAEKNRKKIEAALNN